MAQRVEGSIEIQAPVADVYAYWESLQNLPYFMNNVEEVSTTGPDTSHWRIKDPFGGVVEFEARTTEKEPNSAIGWNTIDGEVGTSGEVRFTELGPGRSRVDVVMNYSDPPGGKLGERASRTFADPQFMLAQDLENLKDILENKASPEEVGQRPSAANVQSAAFALLALGAVLALVGALALVVFLIRRSSAEGSTVASTDASNGSGARREVGHERKFPLSREALSRNPREELSREVPSRGPLTSRWTRVHGRRPSR